jgi:uroporphyrinogen-III synthase
MNGAAQPLAGRRVLITRSEEDAANWAAKVKARGAHAVLLPCIRSEPIDTPALRERLGAALASADWLVLTSRRGAEALGVLTGPSALPASVKVAVVGAATAEAARQALGRVDLIGRGGTAASLAETLIASGELGARRNVLLALAENAGDVLEAALSAAGARCTRCDVYRTVPMPPAGRKRALSALGADNILLASPSAVRGFVHQVDVDAPARVYTIGPSTSAAARAHGLAVTAEAREPTLEALLEAMQWRN